MNTGNDSQAAATDLADWITELLRDETRTPETSPGAADHDQDDEGWDARVELACW
ncbi:hypothetical protein ACFVVA_41430 [Kitasatospora sp. NPDC058048]|uniref:hypothetical protein n=1 Tax=Kitasatospora sp. NPDC058048 TaxID=3346313 RepID=UPI0036DDF4DA